MKKTLKYILRWVFTQVIMLYIPIADKNSGMLTMQLSPKVIGTLSALPMLPPICLGISLIFSKMEEDAAIRWDLISTEFIPYKYSIRWPDRLSQLCTQFGP